MLNKFSWIYYSPGFLELRLNTDKIKYNCVFRSLLIYKNLLSININICLFNLCETPLGETGCLGSFYFTYWLPKHPVIWFILILTQSVRLPMVTYTLLCSTCMTYETLCYAIGNQVLPTQLLSREAEDFPRGDRHFKHVPPPTYLICWSPKDLYTVGSI